MKSENLLLKFVVVGISSTRGRKGVGTVTPIIAKTLSKKKM